MDRDLVAEGWGIEDCYPETAEGSNSELIDLLSCESVKRAIEYILNEAQSCPEDSLVDIANDAFSEYNLPLKCDATFKITEAT